MTKQSSRYTWSGFAPGVFALGAGLVLAGCAPVTNLLSLAGPGFEGRYAPQVQHDAPAPLPIRLVTFNIKYAREIDRAIQVLREDSLRGADVLTLQEMDEDGVDRIARALGLNYAYYPASIHPASGKYFGPAVLSRWPIERSWKLLLPHGGWTRGQRRTATAAILLVRETRFLVYAVHLETPVQISETERRDQAMAVVTDAADYQGPVVIAGDFNSEGIGGVLRGQGYTAVGSHSWCRIILPTNSSNRCPIGRRRHSYSVTLMEERRPSGLCPGPLVGGLTVNLGAA